MRAAIIKDVDTEVSDEEAAQKTIQYAVFSTAGTTDEDGNTTEMTDEEKAQAKDQAQQVLDLVKGGQDLESALQTVDEDKTPSTASYGTDNGSIADEVKEAADKLSDGECADSLVETEDGYYVVVMESTFDEEATENQKQTIVSQRQSDKFDEVYEAWKEEAKFEQNDKVVEKMNFQDIYEMKAEETEATEATDQTEETAESAEETQQTEETAVESESEAQSETQQEAETESAAQTEAE